MTTRNKTLVVLVVLLAAVGLPMLFIGPSHDLDVRLFYTHDEAMRWLTSLSAEDRSSYLLNEYFDLAYITAYTALFCFLHGKWGIVPAILDLIETVPIILYLRTNQVLPEFLGYVSCSKWIVGTFFIVISVRKLAKEFTG